MFFTNSTQIKVTVEKEGEFAGTVKLVDISQANAEIAVKNLDEKDNSVLFTGLTSARLYRIVCEGIDGCTLLIGDN